MTGEPSLPSALATLALHVEHVDFGRLSDSSGERNGTALVRLAGDGAEGLGEDVSPHGGRFGPFVSPAELPPVGRWTLPAFCARLAGLDLWPAPPAWGAMSNYRRWAFEAAALDLAVRQDGRTLSQIVGRPTRPVRFVNSLGLGDDPSFAEIAARLWRYPDLRFKLDADPAWAPRLIDELAATGAVDIVDFKGQYVADVADVAPLERLYDHVLARFPDALLEDPHDLPSITPRVAEHAARVAYDAPVHGVADLRATVHAPAAVNAKPCRIGSLAAVFALYEHCERAGLAMYAGGMASSASAAARCSCSHPCSTPTRLTTSPRVRTTLRCSPAACRPARCCPASRSAFAGDAAGRRGRQRLVRPPSTAYWLAVT